MDVSSPQILVMGLISASAASFWLFFTLYWLYSYLRSAQRQRLHGDSVFYLGALLYMTASVAYYAIYAVIALGIAENETAKGVFYGCYVLYLPLTYFLGTSGNLGFGTLFIRIPTFQILISGLVWVITTLSCTLMVFNQKTASQYLFFLSLFMQILCYFTALYRFRRVKSTLQSHGWNSFSDTLTRSFSQFLIISLLFTLVLVFHTTFVTLYEIHKCVNEETYMGLWIGFVTVTTAVSSWVLWMLKPCNLLWDVYSMAEVYEKLSEDRL